MAAAGWPLPAPLSLVTQAAIASPLGVIAIDGHSEAFGGVRDRLVGAERAAGLRAGGGVDGPVQVVRRSSLVIQASAAELPGPPASTIPWACSASVWAGPKRRRAGARVKTSSVPPSS